jgi:hypothetical protein
MSKATLGPACHSPRSRSASAMSPLSQHTSAKARSWSAEKKTAKSDTPIFPSSTTTTPLGRRSRA